MNAHKLTPRSTASVSFIAAVVVTTATTACLSLFAACSSSNDSNPAPTVRPDSGSKPDAGSSHHPDGGHAGGQDGGHTIPDTGGQMNPPDTGSCKSDSGLCNSCYTDAQTAANPYTACSEFTKNCVPFTTTVPPHPML